jgi:YD repeat-containing protein
MERDRFQAPHRLEIKEGAQVLFVKNNKPYWVNGTLGRIIQIEDDKLRIEINRTGNTVSVERAVWEKIQYEYDSEERRIESKVVGLFNQFPIALGWAITIHKSQGMTLDSVRIDLGRGAFCSGQTYVALSRCRTLEGISLDTPISMGDVKADEMILEFYRRLKPLRNQKEEAQSGPRE